MNKVERKLRAAIESVAAPQGISVEGPEKTGGNHYRWTLSRGAKSRFFITGSTPRCFEVLVRKARSKARRACEGL